MSEVVIYHRDARAIRWADATAPERTSGERSWPGRQKTTAERQRPALDASATAHAIWGSTVTMVNPSLSSTPPNVRKVPGG